MNRADPIHAAMQAAVAEGVFPGAVLAVRLKGEMLHCVAVGRLSSDPPGGPVSVRTVYDLASLTKPLATATALLLLVDGGKVAVETRVGDILTELNDCAIGSATVQSLLSHSSGLPGWRAYYEKMREPTSDHTAEDKRSWAQRQVMELIRTEALLYEPGTRSLYSDVGFMLLGFIVERTSGSPLDRFCLNAIYRPLDAKPLGFLPLHTTRAFWDDSAIAPTELDLRRGRLLRGEVHDDNAGALGGVAGHAGLFGTAAAVLTVSGAWLRAYRGKPSPLAGELVRRFVTRQGVPESSWALGWDTPSTPSSSGRYFSDRSFGHLGYTGTSLWIDPVEELEVVLLSNRVHPTRRNEKIKEFRPLIHDLLYRECVGGR